MNLRQVEALRLVMQSGSVSMTARRLGVSQSAVSKMLRSVEDFLGLPLFEHRRGALTAREELSALMPELEQTYGALSALQQRARTLRAGEVPRVVIGCSAALSMAVVGPACARLMASAPATRITVKVQNGIGVMEDLRGGQIDLAVTQLETRPTDLPSQEVGRGGLMCVVPPAHPLSRTGTITLRQLGTCPIVTYPPTTRNGARIWAAIKAQGLEPEVMTVDHAVLACTMALQLGRPAIIERLFDVEKLFPELEPHGLDPAMPYAIYAVRRDGGRSSMLTSVIANIEEGLRSLDARRDAGAVPH